MKLFSLVSVLVALAITPLAGAGTPGDSPDPPSPPVTFSLDQGYSDTLYDTSGNVVSRASRDGISIGASMQSPWGAASTVGSQTPTILDDPSALVDGGALGPQIAGGCMTHDQYVTAIDSVFRYVVYRYHQIAYWCWDNAWKITQFHGPAKFTDVNPAIDTQGVCANGCYGWYYNWHNSWKGGHYSYRSGKVGVNCVPFTGICAGHAYPWLELWVNAGPWYTGKGGGA